MSLISRKREREALLSKYTPRMLYFSVAKINNSS